MAWRSYNQVAAARMLSLEVFWVAAEESDLNYHCKQSPLCTVDPYAMYMAIAIHWDPLPGCSCSKSPAVLVWSGVPEFGNSDIWVICFQFLNLVLVLNHFSLKLVRVSILLL